MSRVFIDRFDAANLVATVRRALAFAGAASLIRPDTRIFVKPNLTWRRPTPGVTVRPEFLRALVEALKDYSARITIGESEGGQACFQAEEAFESHGLYGLQREFGVNVVNLTTLPHESATATIAGKPVTVALASQLLHETDLFITVPVPKIHAMTGVSLGFKNQWGCLGDKMRVTEHPRFAEAVLAINRLLNTRLCIFDGTYFLDYTGPMMGEPVRMDTIIAGDDVGAASRVCCAVMQVDPDTVPHLRLARDEGMFPATLDDVALNRAIAPLATRQFRLRRAPINYVHLAAFRNRALNTLFYNSAFADGLHEALWAVRRQPLVKRFLYGKFGPGEANRGGRPA